MGVYGWREETVSRDLEFCSVGTESLRCSSKEAVKVSLLFRFAPVSREEKGSDKDPFASLCWFFHHRKTKCVQRCSLRARVCVSARWQGAHPRTVKVSAAVMERLLLCRRPAAARFSAACAKRPHIRKSSQWVFKPPQ